jgi:hypothetical protein
MIYAAMLSIHWITLCVVKRFVWNRRNILFLEINCSTSEKTYIIDGYRNAKLLEWSNCVKLLAGRARLKSSGAVWAYSMVLSLVLEDCIRIWPVKARMFQSILQRRILNTLPFCLLPVETAVPGEIFWLVSSKWETSFPTFIM